MSKFKHIAKHEAWIMPTCIILVILLSSFLHADWGLVGMVPALHDMILEIRNL